MNDATDEDLAAAEELPASSIDAEVYEPEAGRRVPPDRSGRHSCAATNPSGARCCGSSPTASTPTTGADIGAFLASVRMFGEGVDITGERGVEAVCFADTRGSQAEIVQNIGRALRLNRDGSTKVARIIVPVFLEPGEGEGRLSSGRPDIRCRRGDRVQAKAGEDRGAVG